MRDRIWKWLNFAFVWYGLSAFSKPNKVCIKAQLQEGLASWCGSTLPEMTRSRMSLQHLHHPLLIMSDGLTLMDSLLMPLELVYQSIYQSPLKNFIGNICTSHLTIWFTDTSQIQSHHSIHLLSAHYRATKRNKWPSARTCTIKNSQLAWCAWLWNVGGSQSTEDKMKWAPSHTEHTHKNNEANSIRLQTPAATAHLGRLNKEQPELRIQKMKMVRSSETNTTTRTA